MPSTTLMLPSKPITIPGQPLENEMSYREIIKQLAQTTAKPYGDIPPMMKSKKKKKPKKDKENSPTSKSTSTASSERAKPMRRMSHVEDWIVVDSKESLPDEEELVCRVCSFFFSVMGKIKLYMITGTITIQEFSIWRLFHRGFATAHATTFFERAIWVRRRARRRPEIT